MPDVPAVSGRPLKATSRSAFYGISGPKGIPAVMVEILNRAVGEALKDLKLIARLAELGGPEPLPMTPA